MTLNDDLYLELVTLVDQQAFDQAYMLLTTVEDLNLQLELLTRITLTIGRSRAEDLAQDLALARDQSRPADRIRTLGHALDIARALARDLVLARALALDLSLGISITLAGARANFLFHALSRLTPPEPLTNGDLVIPSIVLSGIDGLTPKNLSDTVAPYLNAVIDLQRIISQIKTEALAEPQIKLISYTGVLGLEVTDIEDAISTVWEVIMPWRRQHSRQIAAYKDQSESLFTLTESGLVQNDSFRTAGLDLALTIINRFEKNQEKVEVRRVDYALRLLNVLRILLTTPLQIEYVEPS